MQSYGIKRGKKNKRNEQVHKLVNESGHIALKDKKTPQEKKKCCGWAIDDCHTAFILKFIHNLTMSMTHQNW